MLAVWLLLSAVCIIITKLLHDFFKFRQTMNQLPGDPTHLLLGNLHKHPGNKEEGIKWDYDQAAKYKYFHRFWTGPFSCTLFVFHPEFFREIFKKSTKPRNLSLLASDYDMAVPWLGEGLITSVGPHWHRNRRLITPSFHFDVLKSYIDVFNSCDAILLSKFQEFSKNPQSFDLQPLLQNYTFDVFLRCAMSMHTDVQTSTEPNDYIRTVNQLSDLSMKRPYNPLHAVEFIYKYISINGRKFYQLCDIAHQKTEEIIKQRQQEIENDPSLKSNSKPRDFLDTLIRAKDDTGNGLSLEEIRNEVDTFLFAGHDTTASSLMWTFISLAKNQKYQDKIYEEVKDVLGDREEVKWEDLSKLQFTSQYIKEVLRFYTIAPGITRVTTEDIHLHGHTIPSGTDIFLQMWSLHNNPHVWEDPLEFNPERFSPERAAKMDSFQFLPFSAGSRNCIGQNFALNEMKLTVSQVVRRFTLKEDPDRPALREYVLTLKASDGAFVFAQPRKE